MKKLFLLALLAIASNACACVTYDPSTGTYTVDERGSVQR